MIKRIFIPVFICCICLWGIIGIDHVTRNQQKITGYHTDSNLVLPMVSSRLCNTNTTNQDMNITVSSTITNTNTIGNWWIVILIIVAGIGMTFGIIIQKKAPKVGDFSDHLMKYHCSDPDVCCHDGVCEDK